MLFYIRVSGTKNTKKFQMKEWHYTMTEGGTSWTKRRIERSKTVLVDIVSTTSNIPASGRQ